MHASLIGLAAVLFFVLVVPAIVAVFDIHRAGSFAAWYRS